VSEDVRTLNYETDRRYLRFPRFYIKANTALPEKPQ